MAWLPRFPPLLNDKHGIRLRLLDQRAGYALDADLLQFIQPRHEHADRYASFTGWHEYV
jgi:hypothetical protein